MVLFLGRASGAKRQPHRVFSRALVKLVGARLQDCLCRPKLVPPAVWQSVHGEDSHQRRPERVQWLPCNTCAPDRTPESSDHPQSCPRSWMEVASKKRTEPLKASLAPMGAGHKHRDRTSRFMMRVLATCFAATAPLSHQQHVHRAQRTA